MMEEMEKLREVNRTLMEKNEVLEKDLLVIKDNSGAEIAERAVENENLTEELESLDVQIKREIGSR